MTSRGRLTTIGRGRSFPSPEVPPFHRRARLLILAHHNTVWLLPANRHELGRLSVDVVADVVQRRSLQLWSGTPSVRSGSGGSQGRRIADRHSHSAAAMDGTGRTRRHVVQSEVADELCTSVPLGAPLHNPLVKTNRSPSACDGCHVSADVLAQLNLRHPVLSARSFRSGPIRSVFARMLTDLGVVGRIFK